MRTLLPENKSTSVMINTQKSYTIYSNSTSIKSWRNFPSIGITITTIINTNKYVECEASQEKHCKFWWKSAHKNPNIHKYTHNTNSSIRCAKRIDFDTYKICEEIALVHTRTRTRTTKMLHGDDEACTHSCIIDVAQLVHSLSLHAVSHLRSTLPCLIAHPFSIISSIVQIWFGSSSSVRVFHGLTWILRNGLNRVPTTWHKQVFSLNKHQSNSIALNRCCQSACYVDAQLLGKYDT